MKQTSAEAGGWAGHGARSRGRRSPTIATSTCDSALPPSLGSVPPKTEASPLVLVSVPPKTELQPPGTEIRSPRPRATARC
eukprot:10759-Rhodomonas_salina.1